MTNTNIPAGWYADPQGIPQQLRWWDGSQWTGHTHPGQQPQAPAQALPQASRPAPQQPAQQQAQPAAQAAPPQTLQKRAPEQPAQVPQQPAAQPTPQQPYAPQQYAPQQYAPQQQAGAAPAGPGGGSLFTEPVLVINQKAKLIEVTNEYGVFDQHGNALGTVVQVGQSTAKKVLRVVSSLDQYMTHKLEIRDAYGQPQLVLTRPAKIIKSKVLVARPDGQPVGEIVQQNAIGKINFAMMVNGQQIGAIKAENWRAWNFAIVDHTDTEVARITKTWEGMAKTMFTTADNYVLQIHRQLPDPLLSLVVATALTVDTALKQDARGLG
ncbi:phospholipid scramblase-related protein [Streptomyces sp. NPDC053427]|uniref:phospholipid scramblase-related protein n=1 Tax=Streptomyces sp. NPDC053427 TaxID=3365701 RepID=UPI0037CF0BDA